MTACYILLDQKAEKKMDMLRWFSALPLFLFLQPRNPFCGMMVATFSVSPLNSGNSLLKAFTDILKSK